MKLFLKYLKRHRRLVILSLVLAAINQGFSLCDPLIFGKLVDKVKFILDKHGVLDSAGKFYTQVHFPTKEFILIVITYVGAQMGVAMISRIAKAFQDYTVNSVIQKFGADVYTDGLKHALQLPYRDFEDQRSGETLAVLEKVKTDSEKFISSAINVLFAVLVSIVFVTVYSIMVLPLMILIYFLGVIILGFLMGILSKKIKVIQKKIIRETTALAGATTESLRNIELVKSLGLTGQEIRRLNTTTLKILGLELRKVKSIRMLSFVQGTTVNFLRQTILFCLFYLVFRGQLTFGQIFTLQFFSFFIFGPLQELGNIILAYREAQTSMDNFQKLMDSPVEDKPREPVRIEEIQSLEFKEISYQHKTGKTKALNDISFKVNRGETIAFVGPSGSGKTTLVKLLVGLYKPVEGDMFYNGISYLNLDYDYFRNQIGFVTQDTQLFAGTIRENLVFVQPEATDEEMLSALNRASAQNLMKRAEKGLDTSIGEGGMKISGGEKQRLSIARSLLRHPKLLVFDEATSALDSLTEESITNTIKEISSDKNQINILIAHRLSTILHADRIYVLEKGEIIEMGKHEDLVAEKGLYYAMWRQQIGERQKTVAL